MLLKLNFNVLKLDFMYLHFCKANVAFVLQLTAFMSHSVLGRRLSGSHQCTLP